MSVQVLFMAGQRWPDYAEVLPRALAEAGVDAAVSPEIAPEDVEYIVFGPAGDPAETDFGVFPKLKAVLSLWAGVETVVGNPTLTVPLTRMVDPGLRQGMVEWVTGHVLRHHLGMDAQIVNPGHVWDPTPPPLAMDRRVTVLGLGALGAACAKGLAGLGFAVTGWARSEKAIEGVRYVADVADALDGAEIAVLLLPLTAETEGLLSAPLLARLAPGAAVLNPGRGALVDDDALLAALETGQVGHATLDTFRVEPLPKEHPYWRHPRVTVTPHIASETRPGTASEVIAENLRRAVAGAPLLHVVDRGRGY